MHFAKQIFTSVVTLLVMCGHSFPTFAQMEDALLASVRSAREMKVALGSAPPWSYVSPSGKAEGYGVEMVNLTLKEMGLPPLIGVLTAWDAMIPALQAHQVDFVAPGLTITEARCKVVVYSAPLSAQQDALYVLPGNPKKLAGYSDIARRTEIKLAVVIGSSQEAYALEQRIKPEQLVRVIDVQAGAATVIGGRASAFAVGQFTISSPEQKGLEIVLDKQSPVNGYGVAFRKENARFRDAFDKQLRLLIRDGTVQKLYEKYGIPNGDTAAQLLATVSKAHEVVPSCE
ncbi:transporter substrate-binding domain-containing protein [Bradyrhizobium sp. 153]|uniref:transporter substrate-binding domain-containing protein n=1 Tax=Bradyrhizobium sp. 153 TaxID=2782627 RepID=UPI001FF955E2|nr:transporter substrate-binding domain-containing protein [Bradyrhizobium sp. 153]MCK1669391.1 transporter substrate-binding domain-containing protein [Bradyrhizobium sp. 153]